MERCAYHPYERSDTEYGGAKAVVEEEIKHLGKWRGRVPRNGIALSGGGIRSASFGLGVLQALAHRNLLPEFDYVSSVSGGGYTSAALAYLLHESQRRDRSGDRTTRPQFGVTKEGFPLLSYPMVDTPTPADDPWVLNRGRLLRRLRQNANYLAPGRGITIFSLIAVILRNSLAAVLVHGAVIVIALEVLLGLGLLEPMTEAEISLAATSGFGFSALWLSLYLFAFFVFVSLLYLPLTRLLSRISDLAPAASYRVRRLWDRWAAYALLGSLVFLILGALPYVDDFVSGLTLQGLFDTVVSAKSTSAPPDVLGLILAGLGALANVWAALRARRESERKLFTTILVLLGSAALLFGVVLFLFHWTPALNTWARTLWGALPGGVTVSVAAAVVLLLFGWLPDSTYVSLHRYYRDRLMETFMPDLQDVERDPAERTSASIPGETTMLGSLCGANDTDTQPDVTPQEQKLARGPYPILNANVVLAASRVSGYRGRGGDNFIFTPLVTGSRATGWKRTEVSHDIGPTLATAMAVSGAAINPNTAPLGAGLMRRPVLSVLMSMFNVRLGLWLRNPNIAQDPSNPSLASTLLRLIQPKKRPNLISPGLIESFGRKNLTEESPWVLVTDGGHFENLGLYELIRRRLKLIVICDGSNDPGCNFADLANAVEKVRADFGALIDIPSEELGSLIPRKDRDDPDSSSRPAMAKRGYLKARIRYAYRGDQTDEDEPDEGTLYYLTTTFYAKLSADLYGYRCTNSSFPDQSTGDQFFDERQFEAYRELGFQIGHDAADEIMKDLMGSPPGVTCVVAVFSESLNRFSDG